MQSLRRKIDGAGDLKGVVRSMKALAASSIGQYEKAVQSLDDYYRTVELGLSVCLRQAERSRSPWASARPKSDEPIGAVVFGSDQGLVGRFNEVLVEFAMRQARNRCPARQRKSGRSESAYTRSWRTLDCSSQPSCPFQPQSTPSRRSSARFSSKSRRPASRAKSWTVYLFHNHPKSGAVYEPVSKRLLPLDQAWQNKLAALPWPTKSLPEVIEGAHAGASGVHPRIPLCPAFSGVRGIPGQRKCQPPGGDATRGKEHRRNPGRSEPHVSPNSAGIHRRRAVRCGTPASRRSGDLRKPSEDRVSSLPKPAYRFRRPNNNRTSKGRIQLQTRSLSIRGRARESRPSTTAWKLYPIVPVPPQSNSFGGGLC